MNKQKKIMMINNKKENSSNNACRKWYDGIDDSVRYNLRSEFVSSESSESLSVDFQALLDESLPLMEEENQYEISFLKGRYKNEYKQYDLAETVGFDRCRYSVRVIGIDKDVFLRELEEANGDNGEQDFPFMRVLRGGTANRNLASSLGFPDDPDLKTLSKITCRLSGTAEFVMQLSNATLNDVRMPDIQALTIRVRPPEGHSVLGNVSSYSYIQEREAIETAISQLRTGFGIILDPQNVVMRDVEINLTFRLSVPFDSLRRLIRYFQQRLPKRYVSAVFTESFRKKYFVTDSKAEFIDASPAIEMRSTCKTITIKVYDKTHEILQKSAEKGRNIFIENDVTHPIVRVEFNIKTRKQLQTYFGDSNFLFINQNSVDQAFGRLIEKFFINPYAEYRREGIDVLKNILSELQTGTVDGRRNKWREQLARDLASHEFTTNASPLILGERDLDHLVSCNRTFARHPKKYKEILREVIAGDSDVFPEHAAPYQVLLEFLSKITRIRGLSKHRRIVYVFEDDIPEEDFSLFE